MRKIISLEEVITMLKKLNGESMPIDMCPYINTVEFLEKMTRHEFDADTEEEIICELCGGAGYDEDDEESAAPVHEYPYFDEDKQQHFRLVADEVTDEQFQRILAIGGERVVDSSNRLASVTMVLAWIGFIIFCLAGFAIASAGREFDFVPFLTWCSIGAGCLLSLLWFAEVLKLLQRIHDKL